QNRPMNNKTLFIIFMLLLAVYGATKIFGGKGSGDRSFKTDLIAIDTSTVSSIVLQPKTDNYEEITLKKEDRRWIATQGNITTQATPGSVQSILRTLALIKTSRVAAKKKDKWPDYEVEDGKASRVKVFSGSTLLEDFYVGRFSANQQMQNGTSFVRLANEEEVYAVNGFLSFTFNQGFNSFRDRSLLSFTPADITYLSYTSGDTVINMNRTSGQWYYETTQLDSTRVANFLSNIASTSGTEFADGFDELRNVDRKHKTLTLQGNNMSEPIVITSYVTEDETAPYVIKSSQNVDALFRSPADGIYDRLFKSLSYFTP
ncbi:MAG: DUF4340 domain-containing protein, partial [Bacteroidota bacterium]